MPSLRRASNSRHQVTPDDVVWGVPRREGSSDQDDPLVHSGVVQHAFLVGVDYEAICGFKPPLRSGFVSGTKSPQLALPGRDNPRCPKCASLITSVGTVEEEVEAARAQNVTTESDSDGTDELQDEESSLLVSDTDVGVEEAPSAFKDDAEVAVEDEEDEVEAPTAQSEAADSARDSSWAPRRTGHGRGGRVTVPKGKRSVVVQLPEKLAGSPIAAEIDGVRTQVRVRSVVADEGGTIRITLNQPAPTQVEVVWFVAGSQRR